MNLKDEWERLFFANPLHSPFLAWGWVSAWLKYLAGPHELRIMTLRDNHSELRAIVPLMNKPSSGIMDDQKLFMICGDGPDCSDHLGFLREPEYDSRIAGMVSEGLLKHFGKNYRMRLNSMESCLEYPSDLREALKAHGHWVRLTTQNVCPRLHLPATWDEFLLPLSRNFRSQIKRQFKRISQSDKLSICSVDATESVLFAGHLADLNRARMRDTGKESSLENVKFRNFLVESIQYMADKNIALMDVLKQNGKVVGAALNLSHGNSIYYYMGGFDKCVRKLGPGNAMFVHVIQRGISQGFSTYDFLRGPEAYKYKWGAIDVPIQCLDVYPSTFLRGGSAYARDNVHTKIINTRKRIRKLLKKVQGG